MPNAETEKVLKFENDVIVVSEHQNFKNFTSIFCFPTQNRAKISRFSALRNGKGLCYFSAVHVKQNQVLTIKV